MNPELKIDVKIALANFLKDTNDIMKKYMPDKLGSDAYRAEQVANFDKHVNELVEITLGDLKSK